MIQNQNNANISVSYDTLLLPTIEQSTALQQAFDYFNECLFEGQLPPVYLSLNKAGKRRFGCYSFGKWIDANNSEDIDEICLHLYINRPLKDIFGTLVHEICHHYQFHFGKPGRWGYHNVEFSKIMDSIGLITSHTGKEGGKKLGRQMTHYIAKNGLFEQAFNKMPPEIKLPFLPKERVFLSIPDVDVPSIVVNNKNKQKYTCSKCELNVWAKPNLSNKILCFDCNELLT